MKSEITIDGITYKVGDVLEREFCHDSTVVYIGVEGFTCEHGIDNEISNNIIYFNTLKYYKIKKKTRKVVVERWLNVYEEHIETHPSREEADRYTVKNRLGCEYVKFEYEVEVEE